MRWSGVGSNPLTRLFLNFDLYGLGFLSGNNVLNVVTTDEFFGTNN